jgi:PPK2 family polyphosphate:nucleotide phosphotransferase
VQHLSLISVLLFIKRKAGISKVYSYWQKQKLYSRFEYILLLMYRLNEIDTKAPKDLDKKQTKEATEGLLKELNELQNLLYAESKHAVLVILQGMDASGKDGLIRNVFGQLNPLGVRAQPFRAPSEEELSHDFLWRIHRHAPAKGMMHIFNRSHYEDVLVTRVRGWCSDETAQLRFDAINHFEQLLALHNNTHIFKFYLHISAEEQQQRLQERIDDPAKHWKYNPNDKVEASLRDQYKKMYEDVFTHCSAIPWTIIPSDQNWYKEYLVARQMVEALKALNMQFPKLEL